jgi:hypothetical protein
MIHLSTHLPVAVSDGGLPRFRLYFWGMKVSTTVSSLIYWLAGLLFTAIGLINIGWGNDTAFGVFILLGSLIFYPPGQRLFRRITGYQVPWYLLLALAAFLFWSAMGVGELPAKFDRMWSHVVA